MESEENWASTIEHLKAPLGKEVDSLEINTDYNEIASRDIFSDLASALPNLKDLTIKNSVLVSPEVAARHLPPSIETLHFVSCNIVDCFALELYDRDQDREFFFDDFMSLPKLKELRLKDCLEFDGQQYRGFQDSIINYIEKYRGNTPIQKLVFETHEEEAIQLLNKLRSYNASIDSRWECAQLDWCDGVITVTLQHLKPMFSPILGRFLEIIEELEPDTSSFQMDLGGNHLKDPELLWLLREKAPRLKELTIKNAYINSTAINGFRIPSSVEILKVVGCQIKDVPGLRHFHDGLYDLPNLREVHTLRCRDASGFNYVMANEPSVVDDFLSGDAPIEAIRYSDTPSGVDELRKRFYCPICCIARRPLDPFYKRTITMFGFEEEEDVASIKFAPPTFHHRMTYSHDGMHYARIRKSR